MSEIKRFRQLTPDGVHTSRVKDRGKIELTVGDELYSFEIGLSVIGERSALLSVCDPGDSDPVALVEIILESMAIQQLALDVLLAKTGGKLGIDSAAVLADKSVENAKKLCTRVFNAAGAAP